MYKKITGADTSFLIAFDIASSISHVKSRSWAEKYFKASGKLAITNQIICEYIHVVTDAKRFSLPMSMSEALERANFWLEAEEVIYLEQNKESLILLMSWMNEFKLGRKRILDTLFAANLRLAGIKEIVTTNKRDFVLFDEFKINEI